MDPKRIAKYDKLKALLKGGLTLERFWNDKAPVDFSGVVNRKQGLGWAPGTFAAQKGHWLYFFQSESYNALLIDVVPIIQATCAEAVHSAAHPACLVIKRGTQTNVLSFPNRGEAQVWMAAVEAAANSPTAKIRLRRRVQHVVKQKQAELIDSELMAGEWNLPEDELQAAGRGCAIL